MFILNTKKFCGKNLNFMESIIIVDLGSSSNILVLNWKAYVGKVFIVTLCGYKLNDYNIINYDKIVVWLIFHFLSARITDEYSETYTVYSLAPYARVWIQCAVGFFFCIVCEER